ncbi:MAG TPA: ABC transporter permease [Kofleriaceae bacterium]|nr:ABC transporter permease [Kofleriaceae bacterium]
MNYLRRKLVRDVQTLRWQIVTIALVIAAGVALLVAAFGAYRSLLDARSRFYTETRFAAVLARLARAPAGVADELTAIDGVSAVETRLTFDAPVDLEGVGERVAVRVISLVPASRRPVSRLLVQTGRLPDPRATDEAVVNEAFAKARRLALGDRLALVLNGHRDEVVVVGTVLSAEHMAAFRGGEIIPDNARFGIMWMQEEALASAYQATGTFNEVALHLAPAANEACVIAAVDRVLGPYGGYGAYGRAEQPAHRFVDSELRELEVEATVLPVIFLAVAAFLLNGVLARIVANERTQIATLRALGLQAAPIVRHYLWLAAITATLGAVAGVAAGAALGRLMIASYAEFFRFPSLAYRVDLAIVAIALVVSVGAGLAGAFVSVRRIVALAPAEALQPAAPPTFRASWLERVPGIRRLASSQRLVFRHIAARPLRTASAVVGIAAAMAVLVVGAFWIDSLNALMAHEFQIVRREDATVTFHDPVDLGALAELRHIPGVRAVEGVRAVPVRLSHARIAKRAELLGLAPGARLHRLVAVDGGEVALPSDGLVVSRHLARRLGIGRGDVVHVDVLERTRASADLRIAVVVDELVGQGVYMTSDGIARLMGEAPSVSAALLTIEPGRAPALHEALARAPRVAMVSMKANVVRLFDDSMKAIVTFFSLLLTVFGAAIVIGVVYNAARILVAERARELAAFRVIGFTRADVSEALLVELGVQIALGIPLGALFGYGLASLAVRLFGPEDMSIPLVIGARTWVLAIAVVVGASVASALLVRRRLDRLNLVDVLKVRE